MAYRHGVLQPFWQQVTQQWTSRGELLCGGCLRNDLHSVPCSMLGPVHYDRPWEGLLLHEKALALLDHHKQIERNSAKMKMPNQRGARQFCMAAKSPVELGGYSRTLQMKLLGALTISIGIDIVKIIMTWTKAAMHHARS